MSINIQSVIIEINVRFSGCGLSHRGISRFIGVSQGHSQKSCAVFVIPAVPGVAWHQLKATTWNEDRVLLCIMKGNRFFSASRTREELIRRIRSRIFGRPKTFSSGWVSANTSRQMPQTDFWSSPPTTHIGTPSPELEPSALASCNICWWIQGPASNSLIPLFLRCNNPLVFQEHEIHSGMAITVLWSDTGLISKYQMRPVQMVPVTDTRRWRLAHLGPLVECLEWYPAATKRLWTVRTETQRPICLISPTVIPDTEKNMFPLMIKEGYCLLLMWLYLINVRVAPGLTQMT